MKKQITNAMQLSVRACAARSELDAVIEQFRAAVMRQDGQAAEAKRQEAMAHLESYLDISRDAIEASHESVFRRLLGD